MKYCTPFTFFFFFCLQPLFIHLLVLVFSEQTWNMLRVRLGIVVV